MTHTKKVRSYMSFRRAIARRNLPVSGNDSDNREISRCARNDTREPLRGLNRAQTKPIPRSPLLLRRGRAERGEVVLP